MAMRSSVMRGVMSKETQGAVDSAGRRGAVVVDSQLLETDSVASSAGALMFSIALFVVLFLVVQAAFFCAVGEMGFLSIALGLAAGFLGTSTFHVVPQWEKVVVLRLGKLNRVSGPSTWTRFCTGWSGMPRRRPSRSATTAWPSSWLRRRRCATPSAAPR